MYQVIADIANRPVNELVDMYKQMQPILDHNYNLLMSQSYNTNITKIT